MINKKLLVVPVAALIMGGGALVAAQAGSEEGTPDASAAATIEPPTVLEDWCEFMGLAYGPDAKVPSVRSAFDAALTAGAATPETAYAAVLAGVPPEVEADFAPIRVGGQQLVDGIAVTNPDGVLEAAAAVDAYIESNCGA